MKLSLLSLLLVAFAQAKTPNFVFILADDLGTYEIGAYGQKKIKTPNLDRLAREGIRFTHHYSGAPVCAPARCVLMTGRHLGHAEIRDNGDSKNGRKFPGQLPISAEAITIAEALQAKGYVSGGFGKWGLGPTDSTGSPIRQGFKRFYGYNCQRNAHSFYPPFLDDNEGIEVINQNPIPGHLKKPDGPIIADDYRAETYAPKRILEEALEFLDAEKDKPFFLYLPFVEPHLAMQPPQDTIDQYPEEWDTEKGPYRGQNGYLPHPRPRAGYAAMITDLDRHVGAILARLDQHGLTENTLVIFTSDNGPTHPSRDPLFHVGGADPVFFGSNGPLRGWKGSVNEGGLRVPTLVRWPGKIQANTTTDAPSYAADWFPTLCKIAHAPVPNDLDGTDLTPALLGQKFTRTKPMIWEFHGYGGQLAIIDFPWKAVLQDVFGKKNQAWELYRIDQDPGEKNNLAQEDPETLARLKAAFFADRTDFPSRPLPVPSKEANTPKGGK